MKYQLLLNAIFYAINIIVAIIARVKLGGPYSPKKSQAYAFVWTVIAFVVFMLILFVAGIVNEDSYMSMYLLIAIGVSIYFILRSGYENNLHARYRDLKKSMDNFMEQFHMVNDDIEFIEYCFLLADSSDREREFLAFRKIRSLILYENPFYRTGTILSAAKELMYLCSEYAEDMISVRSRAAEVYQDLRKQKIKGTKSFDFQSVFFDKVDRMDDKQNQHLEKVLESLLGIENYMFISRYQKLDDKKKLKCRDYLYELEQS